MKTYCLLGVTRLFILLLPFKKLAPFLGTAMAESADEIPVKDIEMIKNIGWAVTVMSRYTLWESKCLVQAIVAQIMLRNQGIANTLYLGVGKSEQAEMIAHAWLRSGDIVLTGGLGREKFTVVAKFASY